MPVIVFGEVAGGIGGDHKDTYIDIGTPNGAWGSNAIIWARSVAGWVLGRWSLLGHIPANATINSAIMTLTKQNGPGGAAAVVFALYGINKPWGIDPTDEGVDQNPPAGVNDAATFSMRFFVSATLWGAGNFSAADYGAAIATENGDISDVAGTVYTWDIAPLVRQWILNDATNYGYVIDTDVAAWTAWHSQEAGVAGNRPYLTVDYSLPPSSSASPQSSVALSLSTGMV